jgi:methylmalonyl-CoA mutase
MDSAANLTSVSAPQIDFNTWRSQVEKELRGADFDKTLVNKSLEVGLIQPIYSDLVPAAKEVGNPGEAPFIRGSRATASWSNAPRYDIPGAQAVRTAALEDLQGGSNGLWLQLDACARLGLAPDSEMGVEAWGDGGCMVWSFEEWRELLQDVRLDMVDLALDAGANSLCNFASVVAVARERGEDISAARWNLGLDPLGNLARDGFLPLGSRCMMHQVGTAIVWAKENMPNTRPMVVSTETYHMAGATLAQQVGIMAATFAHYLSLSERLGVPMEDLAAGTGLRLVPGRELFPGIACLRAARAVWSRVLSACGFAEEEIPAPWIHAINSRRTLSRLDPWTNQLRSTTQTLAAVLGGADMITTLAFDEALGQPSPRGRRIARNTQNILAEESHLNQVIDAGGGSYLIESLTDSIAQEAWQIFQMIQSKGGMPAALTEGWLSELLAETRKPLMNAVRTRQQPVTGVSSYPPEHQDLPERDPYLVEADEEFVRQWLKSRDPETRCCVLTVAGGFEEMISVAEKGIDVFALTEALGDLSGTHCEGPKMTPLPNLRDSAGFEHLYDRAEELRAAGLEPKIYLMTLGSATSAAGRLGFARQLFTAGGFDLLTGDSLEDYQTQQAAIVCLCGSDASYAAMSAEDFAAVKSAGAQFLAVAGNPPDQAESDRWQQAGVDGCVALGCDAIAVLSQLQEVYG